MHPIVLQRNAQLTTFHVHGLQELEELLNISVHFLVREPKLLHLMMAQLAERYVLCFLWNPCHHLALC